MNAFDWHADPISRATPNAQNVRRYFTRECGDTFRFDRTLMAWLKDGREKTMRDAADEWIRRQAEKRKA
ncbi:DUF6434 domain-containing protein [Mesorhizobium japonicum]|uniref:DUF6434 domain-containing protein n=1 Tax=Mesorhizobium japonicum TaxID=2066070 RepID=UPI0002E4C673|nr:DUF6434 domain-containing protein [Mesorhizobium japonicum]